MRWLCIALLFTAAAHPCDAPQPLPLRVQIGATSFIAHLSAAPDPLQLQLRQAGSNAVLWSTGPGNEAFQHIFDDSARFSGSLTAVDTDSDGLHDRIYAGDHAGRLWRMELFNGAGAEAFANASVLAHLGDAAGTRRLVAPADVWRAQTGSGSQLMIAIGTAGPGNANRFHVLHDAHPADPTPATGTGHAPASYHLELGTAQSLVGSITVHGRTTLAIARHVDVSNCRAEVDTATLESAGRDSTTPAPQPAWQPRGSLPAHAGFEITIEDAGARLQCRLAGSAIDACSTPVPVRNRFWRREDAD